MSRTGDARHPLLVVSLDGATFDLLEPLMAAGDMPTLEGLVRGGSWARLRSVIPPITPTAWSSFLTGKAPGKHGIFDFRLFDPRTGRDAFVSSRALAEPTVWQLLTAAGRRVGVVGVPMHFPPDPRSGTVVSGFDTPSTEAPFTHPEELRERILARMPDFFFVAAPDPSDAGLESDEAFERFLARVERSFELRATVAGDLLADGAWDAFMVHFQDTDAMQHRVWRFVTNRDRQAQRWERIRRVYQRLDGHLAALRAALPGALVVVLSDHGFGSHVGQIHPNTLLQRWGYLEWRGRRRSRVMRSIRKRLRRFGLASEKTTTTGPWVTQLTSLSLERTLPLVWRRTRAYVAVGHMYGQLYVNLRGRDPHGTVEPGRAYEHLRDELRERFRTLRDPVDGTPLLADVARGEEIYADDRLARRPDLVLVPTPGYTVSRALTHRLWFQRYPLLGGTHRPDGIFVAAGPNVRAGRLASEPSITDVAPTLLAALGVGIPDDVDGRVLDELFVEPPPVVRVEARRLATSPAPDLSMEEEELLAERLRALGYTE